MYDLQYVKKRRRRKIAALVSLFTAIGITSLVIVSFLGRTVGSFSVKLTNSNVKLSLAENKEFKPATSYLNVDEVYPLREWTYSKLPAHDVLDSEELETINDYNLTENDGKKELNFIKYTFYIRNTGDTMARYNLTIKLSDIQVSSDGTKRYLDDTLRVMVYENKLSDEGSHANRVFAKETYQSYKDKDGDKTKREFVSKIPDSKQELDVDESDPDYEKYRLAESFVNGSTAAKIDVSGFGKGDVMRYTLVAWLEGEDPDTDNSSDPPEGASLKLGVDIAAYENA